MKRWRKTLLLGVAAFAFIANAVFFAAVGEGSEPPTQIVTVPSAGASSTVDWTGTIPPNANPTSDCSQTTGTVNSDVHGITVHVPSTGYTGIETMFSFQISWTPANPQGDETLNDEILTVVSQDGDAGDQTETREVGSHDGGSTTETVVGINLAPGDYSVMACGFVNSVPQPYSGTLTLTTVTQASLTTKSADAHGLAFGASVPADPQRDEAEPLIVSDKAGLLYTCGPTGFSNGADYAQVSTDGGNQFHLLGTPPRGQQSDGGGGDCAVATGELPNSQGNYAYAYAGLGALSGFSTSTSSDNGHTLTPAGADTSGGVTSEGALADRQWETFTDDHTVLLTYNQNTPHNSVVLKSTDSGLTFSGTAAIAAPDADFPGPMHWIPSLHTVVMAWTKGEQVNLAISQDEGDTWTDCVVAKGSTVAGGTSGFATADVDSVGNVYVAWSDSAYYHTWLASLHAADVTKCNQSITDVQNTADGQPTVQPGFTAPLQMDRNAVRTTVFPWVAAGGKQGRVAVAFYGSAQDGDPNTSAFKGAWNVYVSQTINAFGATPLVGQAKATTHPFHYDSICLNGLGCDISGGDRSLADFFAMTYNRKTGKLSIVFDRGNKKPDDAAGYVATPMVVTQIAGPSNGGATLMASASRVPLRTSSTDPAGDAFAPYSGLLVSPATVNVPAGDFTSAAISRDATTHGFTVTLKVATLSDTALSQAAGNGSLVWAWRFTNGWQDAAAVAEWSTADGWSFGYDDYTVDPGTCGGSGPGGKCELYPGNTAINGSVNQSTGTITLVVPWTVLHPLGAKDAHGRPTQVAPAVGSRFYDGTAFSFENASPHASVQSWMTQLDNTPAFDFLLPK